MRKIWLIVFLFCSCDTTYIEKIHYVECYDEAKTMKKVEGDLINREEEGEWIFYNKEGGISQIGSYDNGMLSSMWKYNLPGVDSSIIWKKIERGKLNFNLPSTFKLYSIADDSATTIYSDTIHNTVLSVTILKNCDTDCLKKYYDDVLSSYSKSNYSVLYSQSQTISSKSGKYYLDEYDIKRTDYEHVLKQYMVYKALSNEEAIVITITNKEGYLLLSRFLIGEVFYHFKYNFDRIAYPYEEIAVGDVK